MPHAAEPGAAPTAWWAIAVVCLGAMVAPLDTAVNVGFPAIVAAFGVAPRHIIWVVVAFVLTQSVVSLVFGRLGDLFGHRRMFMLGVAASVVAHAVLAVAPDYATLVGLRALQGAAVGMTMACAPALVSFAAAPERRFQALAVYAAAVSAALAIGPIAGGVLIEAFGWPGVFGFRAPFALGVLLFAMAALPAGFDRMGRQTARPVVAWKALRTPRFIGLQGASVAIQAAVFSIMLWVPFALAGWSGMAVSGAGLLIAMFPAGALAASLWLARGHGRSGRMSAQSLVMLGQALSGVGLAMSAAVISLQHPVGLALTLALVGIGLGVFQVGYQDATLDAVPADNRGLAGALINVTRLSGIVLGAFSLGAIGERWGAVGALAVSALALALWAGCLAALLRRGKSVYRDRS